MRSSTANMSYWLATIPGAVKLLPREPMTPNASAQNGYASPFLFLFQKSRSLAGTKSPAAGDAHWHNGAIRLKLLVRESPAAIRGCRSLVLISGLSGGLRAQCVPLGGKRG